MHELFLERGQKSGTLVGKVKLEEVFVGPESHVTGITSQIHRDANNDCNGSEGNETTDATETTNYG